MHRKTFFIAAVLFLIGCAAPSYDLVLRGGRVMDPETGLDSILNVGINGGRIAALTDADLSGSTEIDASGLVVAPGFIDLHAHGQTPPDLALKARDGVTTALELEIGVYPVGEWYATLDGRSPINYGASVGHLNVRMAVFHPELPVLHWPTRPEIHASLGPEPDGTNARATTASINRRRSSSRNSG